MRTTWKRRLTQILMPSLSGFLAGLLFATGAWLLTSLIAGFALQSKELLEQQRTDLASMETALQTQAERIDDCLGALGYDYVAGEAEDMGSVADLVARDLQTLNARLSPPLPQDRLNCREFMYETLRQKESVEGMVRTTREEVESLKADFETERKDWNLQSAIYLQKIERLEKRIEELEKALKGEGKN
ncbi:MAG: hypothetical protein MUC63_05095 [Planctomycetes bacterium]|jgi:chromosome segregation ATPase|nr:hypothetical protein [Planctomycetota bacterium]